MAWQMAAATVAAPIIGGIIGNRAAAKDRKAAQAALQKGFDELDKIGLPPDLSKRILYEQFQQVGLLDPELEQDLELAETQVKMIKEDPSLQKAQLDALTTIMERGRVGLDEMQRAELNKVRQDVQTDVQAKTQQIIQNLAARGQKSPLMEAVLSAQAAQEGADRASSEGDRMMAMAAQNALAAMSQGGQMAGQMQQSQFGRDLARAEAEDKFNLADWSARNSRQAANVNRMNQAEQFNLQNQQRVADANVQMENAERLRMEQAKRDYWNDQLQKASAYTRAGAQVAQGHNQAAQRTADMYSGIGSSIGQGLSGYASQQNTNTQNQLNRDSAEKIAWIKR